MTETQEASRIRPDAIDLPPTVSVDVRWTEAIVVG
jgi:hypothetical protein